MRRFLLGTVIFCGLALLIIGCGKSSETTNAPEERPVRDVTVTPAPAVEPGQAVATTVSEETPTAEAEAVPPPISETAAPVPVPAVVSDAPAETVAVLPSDQGSNTVADVIEMKNTAAFPTHLRGIVMFGHKKHIALPPDGYGLACGECHHDKDGRPLDLKAGDFVQGCMTCHEKPDKPKKPAGISPEQWRTMELEYYYGAIHGNCIDCHKAGGAGPVKCNECHPAEKR